MTIEKKFPRHYRYLCLIISVVFLSACASTHGPVRVYDGAKRPDNEIVRFLIPSALEVVALDGKELKTPYIPDGQNQLELLPGDHELKVIYTEYWGDPSSGGLEVSDASYFKLATTAGSTYVFKHNGPTDLVHAGFGMLVNDIKIWLEQRETGKTINAVNRGAYGGILTRTIRQVVTGKEEGKPKEGVTALQKTGAKVTPATPPLVTDQGASSAVLAEQITSQQNAVDRLKFWWKMADEKQRKAFQIWIINGVDQ